MNQTATLQLHGMSFSELLDPAGLTRLDARFLDLASDTDPTLGDRLRAYRQGTTFSGLETSELLLALAPMLETFIASLFGIGKEVTAAQLATLSHDPIMAFKKQFVARRARRYRGVIELSLEELQANLEQSIAAYGYDLTDREAATAIYALALLGDEQGNAAAIEALTQWCAFGLKDDRFVANWVSFKLPARVDHAQLVPLQTIHFHGVTRLRGSPEQSRRRDGFKLTDGRMNVRQVQDETHYCIYCHDHDGDFCSKGFPEKKGQPELGFKVDPLDVTLTGCPLEEKISEMNLLKRDGYTVGALAIAMVDNPMIPATGHRICNDCMKGCIYQKQDPVNIPQIETRVLTDVLALPWGVEIYDLLTRWNPLRNQQFLAKPYNGRKVLVVGMGPAGFTMAHHLTLEGCAVVGVDGLKIEPLPDHLLNQPVRNWEDLVEPLDERILLGFGGVAEYGITVRWDKNFLKLIYLSLARRANFQAFGGVRLGGTLTLENAWELGFDHVCLAVGAGLPRILSIGNSLARGMRQASDFLMALQLTGAGKESSLANLQLRLPAVVIGGGLTAVDTATEVQAYYIKQVEKALARHEALLTSLGEAKIFAGMPDEDKEILSEFLLHGQAVRAERARAAAVGEQPNFTPLLHAWGGVTLTYRRALGESPAYTRNHEEVIQAMNEGLFYMDGCDPLRVELDQYKHVRALVCRRAEQRDGKWLTSDEEITLPARAVFVAAGSVPNTIYEREYPGTFKLEDNHFLGHIQSGDDLQPVAVADHCKEKEFGVFTSVNADGRLVSYLGDTHPVFHGSVVKAIASAKRGYPQVVAALAKQPDGNTHDLADFRKQMAHALTARIAEVKRTNPAVTEIWVRAPMAARNFQPGQFFRMQTFESLSPIVAGTRLQVPLLTVSGTGVKDDMIRLMVLQWGAGPRLVGRLNPGDPVVLMGPTGAPTDIPTGKTVMIVAGRWGAAVMHDIGPALRAGGNRVVYVAAFSRADELDNQTELEEAADQIIWCTAAEPRIQARRPQDLSVTATDMIKLLHDYAAGGLGTNETHIPLGNVDRIMVMGSTSLLKAFQKELRGSLKPLLPAHVEALGTAGSPMQCMLKGVCAQCVQWQIDPATGNRTRPVFSCAQQDQPLEWLDLDNLAARQSQNRLTDRLTGLWLDYILKQENTPIT